MDQKELYAYLKKPMSPDDSREALYKASIIANNLGWTFMEASFQLGDKAREDGLSKELIEATIRKAFSKERRKAERDAGSPEAGGAAGAGGPRPEKGLELDEESLELLNSHRINPDALSIPWPSDDWRKDLVKLLKAAFNEDESIEFKVANTDELHKESVSTILAQEGGINKIMRALDSDHGALININATTKENATDDSHRFRYVVVDSPQMSLAKQLAYYKALNLPCVALVASGANSVQAWIRIEAFDSNEFTDRVDFLYSVLEEQGFKVDHSNKRSVQMVRMPGVLRNGKQQYLIGTNEGAKSWKEWEEWVDYCLDGNPIAEQASYHTTPPVMEPELVSEIVRRSQTLIVQGPPKSGKSFLMLNLALSVCYGNNWLNHRTANSDVLYVNFEQDKASFINRLHEVAGAKDVSANTEKLGFFHLRGFPKHGLELAQFLSKRIRGARKHEDRDYGLIIIDPIHKVLPPNIAKEQQAAMLRQFVDHITATSGAAVVGTLPLDYVEDSSWCDGLISLRSQSLDDFTQIDGLFKSFPAFGPLECQWQYPLLKVEA